MALGFLRKLTQHDNGAVEHETAGTIVAMRVEKDGAVERWHIELDTMPGQDIVFEPSPLSPPRHRGERVRLGYHANGSPGPLVADWIWAA